VKKIFVKLFAHQSKPDYVFVISLFCIIFFGLVMLSSASSVLSYQKFHTPFYYIVRQILFGIIPGLILFFICSRIDYHVWQKYSFLLLSFSILLLIAVFLPGIGFSYGGARRWIHMGSFLIQPSEIVKLTFLLYLASWFSNRETRQVKDMALGFLPFLVLVGIVASLIILQPDVGTMGVIIMIAFSMYFLAGAHIKHIILSIVGGIAALGILIKIAPYRLNRFTTFLNPDADPLGIGYHINQALLAVGSGGLFGRGFGQSRQKFAYLPEAAGDSIFAIISEELGFILSFLFIALCVFFVWKGLQIARNAPDRFGMFVVSGVMAWIIFQTFINIGAMLALVPLTGIPLPFISYGASSLIVLFIAMGIVVNVSRQTKRQ